MPSTARDDTTVVPLPGADPALHLRRRAGEGDATGVLPDCGIPRTAPVAPRPSSREVENRQVQLTPAARLWNHPGLIDVQVWGAPGTPSRIGA